MKPLTKIGISTESFPLFSIQDVCILLSITLLIVMILTTYVAQAGLLCLLLRMFRFSILITCVYLVFCAVIQALLLVSFCIRLFTL